MVFLLAGAGYNLIYATHNLAGEITYRYISGNTIEITLATYTDPSAALVDRCIVDLEIWKDDPQSPADKIADLTDIPRQNGLPNTDPQFPGVTCPGQNMGEYIVGSIKRNIYRTTYTFAGPGKFLIRYYDLARIEYVNNISNSGNQAFFVESTVFIAPILGDENSPQFLNHPIDFACTGKLWTHNPGGYDPDGDSLVYSLVPCRQYDPPTLPSPIVCSGFQDPGVYGSNGPMTMNPETGLITWNTPQDVGWYNIAYKVEEYRRGVLIGTTYRDMAIEVSPCDNNPPIINSITDTCIYAGDTLRFEFEAYDPDFQNFPPDSLYFYLNNNGSNNNGPFSVAVSPATLNITSPIGLPIPPDLPIETRGDTVKGFVEWATRCEHLRNNFYQIDFYAHDNLSYADSTGNVTTLSAHHVVQIHVIPRPLDGLVATLQNGNVLLNWNPNPCDSTIAYEIFRKDGGGYAEDTVCCEEEPTDQGWELVGTTQGQFNTTFLDENGGDRFPFGEEICYLVRAVMANGQTSCATNIECVEIEEDFAVLLQDSIDVTDNVNGEIQVSWSQPSKIDTAFFPQPYTYTLLRADGMAGPAQFQTVATGINFDDTLFFDQGRNTVDIAHRYRVDTYDANGNLIAEGNVGSSIYLNCTPMNEAALLEWSENVPWDNRIYYIYRADDDTGPLTLIDSVVGVGAPQHTYIDTGLTNFEDYCYVIVSEGEYTASDEVPDSVRNASQRVCCVPVDMEPPCIGSIEFDTSKNCVNHQIIISWTEPDSLCGADTDFYTIWRADNRESQYVEIARVDSGVYVYAPAGLTSIADCYGVTVTDTNGNESPMIIFCFENCPEVEISNVFTPNGDDINDFFSPVTDRNIRVSEVIIYDRWGATVYQSNSVSNPARLWDGRTNDGSEVPEGVYYYLIRYEEDRLPDYIPKVPLTGHVNLIR